MNSVTIIPKYIQQALFIEFLLNIIVLFSIESFSFFIVYVLLRSIEEQISIYSISYKFSHLPNGALFLWIHLGTERAIEVLGEFLHIRKGSQNTEFTRTMKSGCDAKLHRFRPVLAAPGISCAYPEQLFR